MREFSAQSRLVLIRVKIERAKTHLKDFEEKAAAFRDAYMEVVGTKHDPNTLQAERYFAKLPISKLEVLAIAGDVVQNLRSALDHLIFQLVEANQCRPIGEKMGARLSFPIFASAKKYKASARGKVKGARKGAIKLIDSIKPYKGGNGSALWALHHVNRIDKHRYLVDVGPNYLFEAEWFNGAFWKKAARPLFRGIFGPEVDNNAKFTIKKPVAQSKIMEGQPLLEFLREQVQFVDSLIGRFEPFLYPRRRRKKLP